MCSADLHAARDALKKETRRVAARRGTPPPDDDTDRARWYLNTLVRVHDPHTNRSSDAHSPRSLVWPEAPAVLHGVAASILARSAGVARAVVVGITGPVGAGKSLLASRLSACVLSTDDYLPDYDRVPYEQRDDPAHADFDRLRADLELLRRGLPARVPVWSFQTHRREGERKVTPREVVVVEGIHALHERHSDALDLRVFVEAPPGVRWSRWERLESSGQRGWGVEVARRFFDEVAEPTFARFEARYRAAAHYVVRNERDG
jgi:uridine kinase